MIIFLHFCFFRTYSSRFGQIINNVYRLEKTKKRGTVFVACSTPGGLRIARDCWTKQREAHADMNITLLYTIREHIYSHLEGIHCCNVPTISWKLRSFLTSETKRLMNAFLLILSPTSYSPIPSDIRIDVVHNAKLMIIQIRTKKMGVFLKNEFTELRIYESTEQLWLMVQG